MMTQVDFDAISVDYLRGIVGKKWSTFPDCTGAFIAEMDFGTAPSIKDALRAVVDEGFFGYLPDRARDDLREACAGWYRTHYNWDIPLERIDPLPDVLKGLEVTIEHFSKPGSKAIVCTPAYMPFLFVPQIMGREHIEVPMIDKGGRWEFDFDAIDAAFVDGGGVFILCNPFNPLGRVLERDEMIRICEIVDKHGGRVFSDEIHAPITFPGHNHIPYASISDVAARHTITAVSASKAWNLAGLKCAQIILSNDADMDIWKKDAQFATHGASSFGVIANTVAYSTGRSWLDDVLAYLDGNRQLLAEMLKTLLPEIEYQSPEGTYLAWLDFRRANLGEEIDLFFRERAQVAVVNGRACGVAGEGFVRFNFAMPRPILEQAVERMATAVRAS